MSRRRHALWVLLACVTALALTAGVMVVAGPDAETRSSEDVTSPAAPWAAPSPTEVAALPTAGCGVVRYTPPSASAPHDGDLCRPSAPRGQAVVLVHGGGGYSGDRSGLEPWSRWYRSQGFVTLAVDYTLVGDGSATPVYPAPERDIKAAVQFLRRMHVPLGIDAEAIVLHGSSEGARLGGQVLVTAADPWFDSPDLWPDVPDHVNGLIGFYGYYDGSSLVADQYFGGPSDSGDPAVVERLEHADSVAQAGAATGPVLLFHGDVDGLIDVGQTERFGRALAEAGTPVSTHILVDENHAFDQRPGDPFTDVGRIAAREILSWIATALPQH